MKKDIRNYNDKREFHGYQEWYSNGNLWMRTYFKNNKIIGYQESHTHLATRYFIR